MISIYWGPAIMFIILGSVHYRFTDQLYERLKVSIDPKSRHIGRAFWRGGWFALLWAIVISFFPGPGILGPLGIAAATIWVGIEGMRLANQMVQNK